MSWPLLSINQTLTRASFLTISHFLKKTNSKRHDTGIKEIESKQDTMKENITKIQTQLQQAKLKMAMK